MATKKIIIYKNLMANKYFFIIITIVALSCNCNLKADKAQIKTVDNKPKSHYQLKPHKNPNSNETGSHKEYINYKLKKKKNHKPITAKPKHSIPKKNSKLKVKNPHKNYKPGSAIN